MAIKKDISSPKKGMNRDSAPFELGPEEYSFLLNGNIHDEHGNGKIVIQNEPSNVKCSGFKAGYKVVGHKFDINSDQTYFMLFNPTTGFSEIGRISSLQFAVQNPPVEQNTAQGITVVLENPLEGVVQTGTCSYETLMSDECATGSQSGSKCLNFSLDDPFHENNIHIKYGKRGTTLWFFHRRNPSRYIELDDLTQYTQTVDPCTDVVTDLCLNCDKMRVFPLVERPCLTPNVLVNGGQLRAGVIEVLISYSDSQGNELTDYYSITNPISIFDKNNRILNQTQLDYLTTQAVSIDVDGADDRFEYYKIAVIHRSGLDGAVIVYNYGVFPINQSSVTITALEDKQRMDMTDVIQVRPIYTSAKGAAVANGYLYQYGLETQREVNLQPIVNLLGAFARWSSYQAMETLYEDGVNVSNFQTVMRDEVYPYSIRFGFMGGYTTALWPLIARPPLPEEVEVLDSPEFPANTETNSVLTYNKECAGNARDKRWQFENTAQVLSQCVIDGFNVDVQVIEREVESSCFVTTDGELTVVDTIVSSSMIIPSGDDIVTYINSNAAAIIASTGTNGADIRDIIEDPTDYPDSCEPPFDETCGLTSTLVEEEIFAIAVEGQVVTDEPKPLEDYVPMPVPSSVCTMYQVDTSNNNVIDAGFVTNYMEVGDTVYARFNPTNAVCTSAATVVPYSPGGILPNYHMAYKGESITVTTLRDTRTTSETKTVIDITLTGTSGSINVVLNGFTYPVTFNTDIPTTAADFITLNAVQIATDITGFVATATATGIHIEGPFSGFYTVTYTAPTGTMTASHEVITFSDKLHTNAIWFKVEFSGATSVLFELGTTACQFPDDNTRKELRISAFDSCTATTDVATYGTIIADVSVFDPTKFVELFAADFGGTSGIAYIAIDSPIRTRDVVGVQKNTLTPPCDCYSVSKRAIETAHKIEYTNLTFGKRQTYMKLCTFTVPILNNCTAVPFEKGLFSYWESTQKYPCNQELYDSSNLTISPADIPLEFLSEFESYFTTGISGGNYILNAETDFRDKPIRHYKYPDNRVSPFMSTKDADPGAFNKSVIYPLGFNLSVDAINAFLDIAAKNGLITAEERSKITSYEIFRGDRRIHRSVIAKGLLFDMYKYLDGDVDGTYKGTVYYPNYPLNTLGTDRLNGGVAHPFGSSKNNFFTFHSPDTEHWKPTIPREMRVEGYLFGNAANYFDEVKDHPTGVVLGKGAYSLAATLATIEVVLELLLQVSTWLVTAGAGGVSTTVALILAAVAIVALVIAAIFKGGEYYYKWTEIFTNLGKPTNFAYYQVCVGYYNVFKSNDVANQVLRGLAIGQYTKDGFYSVTDEQSLAAYNINNLDREYSVAIHTGTHHVNYPSDYIPYDNSSLQSSKASRTTYPNGQGKSLKFIDNAASPYASLKQYLPAQYGDIESVEWINTGFCGSLLGGSDCDAAFGGDTFISRHSLRRKLPFFRTNAFGLAPLTPYKYSDYFNINPTVDTDRFFLDYEINDDGSNYVAMFVFPTKKSKYNLDPGGTEDIEGFYVKPPNKFYLFSYGIPHFLVESNINSNYRYAMREPQENFYPNVNDVVDWTQEGNMSIRQPNTYFYNTIYSAAHSFSPWRTLPQNYSRELYDRLNDLRNTVVYSAQDLAENSLVDPWLRYKALDTYTFSKAYGDLITIAGIESLQLLARFTNGFSIFGAIDQMRDRLTPDTQNLGNGGIFAGRPVNFNTTDLGYAGTQHNAKISCEFGHFWPDTKRGKFFNVSPNGEGLEEISKAADGINSGLEKWFKDNLPFKILNYFPDYPTDNAYNGVGITMGWDDRLKRLLVTKKDYVPKDPNLQYNPSIGFYSGSLTCPVGYTYNPLTEMCEQTTFADKIPTGVQKAVIPVASPSSYGFGSPALYSAFNPDGSGFVDGLSPTGYTFIHLPHPFWTGYGVVANRIGVRVAKWVSGAAYNTWYGSSFIVDIPTTGTYYVLATADNQFRISLNGVTLITSDATTIWPQHGDITGGIDTATFRRVHIYPIEMPAGCNIFKIEGKDFGGEGMFGAAIINNTAAELEAATIYDTLNVVFSTETATVFYESIDAVECPPGFTEESVDICAPCVKVESVDPGGELVEIGDPLHFDECSWTLGYNPMLKTWISYYSFLPNYYVSYNDFFQTGLNVTNDNNKFGLWSHLPFLSSYQVFYGDLYPFIIEYALGSNLANSSLNHIEYYLDVRKYYNKFNFTDIYGIGFNKATVYNPYQNTGELHLIHQQEDNMYQMASYPKHYSTYVEILQTEMNGRWTFNYLYNAIKNERAGLPVWWEDCSQIMKTLDNRLLNYESMFKDYMRGDYFIVRLTNDSESRYKFLFRLGVDERNYYIQ